MKKIYAYILMVLMLSMATTTFTSCETEDQYEAEVLIAGDWQGYLGTYYYDRWGLSGNTYETVIRFCNSGCGATSGRGYEVDYDTRSPFYDYAYCEFSWSIVNGTITLIYDDSVWYPVYINDYSLYHDYFTGYMNDGTCRNIHFRLNNVRFGYWDTYRNYCDDYYYARTRAANGQLDDFTISQINDSTIVPFINRTEQARQESGEPNTVSILSGVFAEKWSNSKEVK